MKFSDRGRFLLKLIPVVLIMALLSSSAEAQGPEPGGFGEPRSFRLGHPLRGGELVTGRKLQHLPSLRRHGWLRSLHDGTRPGVGRDVSHGSARHEHVERANGDAWSNFEPRPDPWKHHTAGSTGGHEQRNGAGRDVWYLDTTHAIGRQDGSNEMCPGGELSFPDPTQLARPRHPLAGHVDVRTTGPSTPMFDTRAFFRDLLGRNDASYS